MISLLVSLLILAVIIYCVHLILGMLHLPQPIMTIIYIIIALIVIIYILDLLNIYSIK